MTTEKQDSRFCETATLAPPSIPADIPQETSGGCPIVLGSTLSNSDHGSFLGISTSLPEATESKSVANSLYRRATALGWYDELAAAATNNGCSPTCVAIKQANGAYACSQDDPSPSLLAAIIRLGENVTMSMTSQVSEAILEAIKPEQTSLVMESTGARIPIIAALADVHQSLIHSASSCIVIQERCVLIWSKDTDTIIDVAQSTEKELLGFMIGPSMSHGLLAQPKEQLLKSPAMLLQGAMDKDSGINQCDIKVEEDQSDQDLEGEPPVRPILRVHSFRIGIVMILIILTQSLGVAKLVRQWSWDGDWKRFILIAGIPPLCLLSLFFFTVVVNSVFQLLLPTSMCLKNSKYHSAIKPNRHRYRSYELPHITVQMPVHKEDLQDVIVPTMISVMAAIEHYENQGGTASVFINDDGMQCIQPELAAARKKFYRENNIGYCARLPTMNLIKGGGLFSWFSRKPVIDPETVNREDHELSPQDLANKVGFIRKGKFKKASNMNYCLDFSNRVEDEMYRLTELECRKCDGSKEYLTAEDDDELYEVALQNMIDADGGKTWAEGNIRMGEIILIIDCDTRVPVDCLLYGALEMHESPEVAILQHGSGVMQVAHNTIENGIAYFTKIVYTAIRYGAGTGDVAPFVGHNAFLRWKAIQSVAFVDPLDGVTKWWSDSHVSEDFDLSLRIQMAGMICRLATYHNGGFKEGVSLTVYDELNRWEKYAYGCNELVFHPFNEWIFKGPVTRLFLRFLWSNIPVTSKVSIIAYIFTYYAIAAGMALTIVNYFIVGLFFSSLDRFYMHSWGIWLSLLVVFNGVATVSFCITRHRLKEGPFWLTMLEAVKWLPFLILFFSGISINCAKALLCHAFSINIQWSWTSKELGPTGISIGLNRMMHHFKYTFLICILISAGMVYMAFAAPWGWNIAPSSHSLATYAIVPLAVQVGCSFTLPIFLGLK